MVSPTGAHRFTIDPSPIGEVDMRALVERLRTGAEQAGAEIRWGATDVRVDLVRGRPTAVTATIDGEAVRFATSLVVDAAGLQGTVRTQVPSLAAACPAPAPADLCSAQQLVVEITDPDGARAFLKEHEAEPGDAVIVVGAAGGYSTVNINVDESLEEVAILTGSIPEGGHATGPDLLKAVRSDHAWMGRTLFGGGGLIPLRRVYDRFTAPGLALVGDAACQVMPGHGSGIGFGLIAGKVLAEAVGDAEDPGDPDVLWRYQASYLREFGAILAGYDAVRRMSVRLGSGGVEELFASGIFSPALVRPGLEQKLGMLGPAQTAAAARTLAGRPHLARIVVPALAAMTTARALYAAYPRRSSERAFRAWRASARLLLPEQGART
ncbi:NAD(P)/FAD-dependent oxidoreductase [Aquihabitans daechungensis]|uniref:NAD(P)/FAD-dependent oxidoreductase n=1 Tax=Aquihabitans daechungensis TaxID=1052257 RepID=UPI003B9EAFF3